MVRRNGHNFICFHVQGGLDSLKSQIKRICDMFCPSFELVGLRGCNNLQLADRVKPLSPRWSFRGTLQKERGISVSTYALF